MKEKKHIWRVLHFLRYYGLWTVPPLMVLSYTLIRSLADTFSWEPACSWLIAFVLSLGGPLYIYESHKRMLHKGIEDDLPFAAAIENRPTASAPEKNRASRPRPDNSMLFPTPEGIVYGQFGRQYVCKPLEIDGHTCLIGGSGSGKSSTLIIDTLLANPTVPKLVLDIKGELYDKTVKAGDPNVCKVDFTDRSTYGFSSLYKLTDSSSEQEIVETMEEISNSLITMPASLKDPFWKMSARYLMQGLMIAYYKQGIHDFIDITDKINDVSMQEQSQLIVESAEESSIERSLLAEVSKAADETFTSIALEVKNALSVFKKDQNIRFAFSTNPLKVNPKELENKSIFLCVPEHKLTSYANVIQMIFNLVFSELEQRPEDSSPILLILDELPRILSCGRLSHLLDGIRTLRSRRVQLILATQSIEALMEQAYSENEVMSLISNCNLAVLSATSPKTQRLVCDLCGQYMERKKSWSGGGAKRRTSVSFEDKKILTPSELITLPGTGEMILLTSHGYNRIRKAPYYEDHYFKSKAEEIENHNRIVKGEKI